MELESALVKINDEISYLNASEDPISANVVFIKPTNSELTWIFDVGLTAFAAAQINAVKGRKNIVLSHFHPDHIFNLSRVNYEKVFVSRNTFKYTKTGILVENTTEFDKNGNVKNFSVSDDCAVCDARNVADADNVVDARNAYNNRNSCSNPAESKNPQKNENIKIIPLPSSHAKGSLILEYGDYAFCGDGTYCMSKNGKHFYNATLLFDEIRTLEKLSCTYLCLSHDKNFVQNRKDVINLHKEIYSRRKTGEPFISVDDFFDKNGNVIK